jgi:neutral ceramidase
LFLPGAGADQDPEPAGSVELSRRHGQELADAVSTELSRPGLEIDGPLQAEMEDVLLPLQPVSRESLERMLSSDDRPQQVKARFLLNAIERGEKLITRYPAPVQVLRLGDELLLVALSGEPVIDWSIKQKRDLAVVLKHNADSGSAGASPSRPVVWVAGYCHDMFGYLPTRRVQGEGGYEGGRATLWSSIPAPFTEEAEDLITNAIRRLVQRTANGSTQDSTNVR